VGVGQGSGDLAAIMGVLREGFDFEVVCEEGEADLDHIAQVHLQRLNGAEAPEDRKDYLPERFHGWSIRWLRGP